MPPPAQTQGDSNTLYFLVYNENQLVRTRPHSARTVMRNSCRAFVGEDSRHHATLKERRGRWQSRPQLYGILFFLRHSLNAFSRCPLHFSGIPSLVHSKRRRPSAHRRSRTWRCWHPPRARRRSSAPSPSIIRRFTPWPSKTLLCYRPTHPSSSPTSSPPSSWPLSPYDTSPPRWLARSSTHLLTWRALLSAGIGCSNSNGCSSSVRSIVALFDILSSFRHFAFFFLTSFVHSRFH